MTDALIIIDMQQGAFVEVSPKHDASGLVGRLNQLADAVRTRGGAVIFIQHEGPPGDPLHPDQPGWRLLDDLSPRPDDTVIGKNRATPSWKRLSTSSCAQRAVDRLIITGWATDYCVDTTVRSALARGYPTVVPSDGHTRRIAPICRPKKSSSTTTPSGRTSSRPAGRRWSVPSPTLSTKTPPCRPHCACLTSRFSDKQTRGRAEVAPPSRHRRTCA